MLILTPLGKHFERETHFPLRVSGLFQCLRRRFLGKKQSMIYNKYEITLRLDSDTPLCMDEINGVPMKLPYPNVVFKTPGMKIRIGDDSPREAIGFSYPLEVISTLREWNMLPPEPFLALTLTPELQRLVNEFSKFMTFHSELSYPGDRIDSICFEILREILLNRRLPEPAKMLPEQRIDEVERYLQYHYDEEINLDELAHRFGFSHSGFYQCWKKLHDCTPLEYIARLKIKQAASELLQSRRSIAAIARKAGFTGTALFYRKFREQFQMTPGEFRKNTPPGKDR